MIFELPDRHFIDGLLFYPWGKYAERFFIFFHMLVLGNNGVC